MTDEVDQKRRGLLKKGALGLGGIALASASIYSWVDFIALPSGDRGAGTISTDVPDDPNKHWGFVIDLSKCDGCEDLDPPTDDPTGEKPRCSYACRKSHYFMKADPAQHWIRVYKLKESPEIEEFFFPKPCQNCQEAPCHRVCPTGATYQRKDGTILINHPKCIGCRICMAACPYETRFFWYSEPIVDEGAEEYKYSKEYAVRHTRGTVSKCDLCVHNAYANQLPHCVSACPNGAIYYGDLNEDVVSNGRELLPLHETINNNGGYRYKEDEGTEPSVYYLPVIASNFSKQNTSLKLEIGNNLVNDELSVVVGAEGQNGEPIKSTKIIIEKETTFGPMTIAEGLTDIDGVFSCSIKLSSNDHIIKARMKETERYRRNEVSKHVR